MTNSLCHARLPRLSRSSVARSAASAVALAWDAAQVSEPWLGEIGGRPWATMRALVPAGHYAHAAARVLQLRLVRRGSSYLTLDLGAGVRRVYTRPGDLLLSLPHSATSFDLDAPRHLTVVCVAADPAERSMRLVGGETIGDLARSWPVRSATRWSPSSAGASRNRAGTRPRRLTRPSRS
jgi:hypothetical protein